MAIFKWLFGGLFGALVGIAIWSAIVYFTGYEFGLVAAFIGIFVGVGIAAAAGPNRGTGAALFAACMAFLSVLGGKAAVAWIYSQHHMDEMALAPEEVTDEYLISCIADEILYQYEDAGYELDYPPGADLDYPDSEGDYPAEVWAEAESQWYAMDADGRRAYRDSVEIGTAAAPLAAFLFALIFSFGLFDFVWVSLAVSSAYKIVKDVPQSARQGGAHVIEDQPEQAFAYLPGLPPPNTAASRRPPAPFVPGAPFTGEAGEPGARRAG